MEFTEANFMALIESAEGTPYKFGGINPFAGGADCSGLVVWAGKQCGVTLPRTTEAEYADLEHIADPTLKGIGPGNLVEFEVPGDGGAPPQHVGVYLSSGTMIDDPETGQVVSVQKIPNVPGVIWPIGYCILPFVTEPVDPPAPAPKPPVDLMELFTMNCLDPTTGGTWIVDPTDGHVETLFGAPYLGAMNEPQVNRDNWQGVGYISGITPWEDPGGTGWGYAIIVHHNTAIPGTGAWYSPYTFRRSGQDK